MQLRFRPLTASDVQVFATWRYDPPYDIYNIVVSTDELQNLIGYYTDPACQAYAIDDHESQDGLVAFCSFGADAQVPGGDYSKVALDIGMGVRPDLTGHGLGHAFALAVIQLAERTFAPTHLRVTIAAFNIRAQRVWAKLGFEPVQTFASSYNAMPFIIYARRRSPIYPHTPAQTQPIH